MMPALFLAHGAPTLAIEENEYVEFLRGLGQQLPRPKAVVLFSAHWESGKQLVGGVQEPGMIYDFYGFPEEMYRIEYPAKGEPALAAEVVKQFEAAGVPCQLDTERGMDHGTWVLLKLLYPQADIPVVTLSVHPYLAASEQYAIGKALTALRAQDVLIIGSGGTVHNLRQINWRGDEADSWAVQFDDWLGAQLTAWNLPALFDYENGAPAAKQAVPRPEHFVPLLLAMGSADDQQQAKLLFRAYQMGSLSLVAWQFGGAQEN